MPEDQDIDQDHADKPFAVVDTQGSGWGRYKTVDEALERARGLEQMRGVEFNVFKRIA